MERGKRNQVEQEGILQERVNAQLENWTNVWICVQGSLDLKCMGRVLKLVEPGVPQNNEY